MENQVMTTYIALLKGINVGGKNIIKMAELKQHLSKIGLNNVRTYIQSGNVIFESEKAAAILRDELEKEIEKQFGFQVPVFLRTLEEMKRLVAQSPFSKEKVEKAQAGKEAEVFYVSFFNTPLSEAEIQHLSSVKAENEYFEIIGKDIYLLFNDSIRFSKLATTLLRLKTMNTVRNGKTVNKLILLSS